MKPDRTALRHALLAGAALVFGLALALALASCNFGFLDDADLSGTGEVLREEVTTIIGGERHAFYNTADELQYYEDHYITAAKTMLLAYYNASNELRWYRVFTYNGETFETITEYDGADARQWSRRYEYGDGSEVPATTVINAASFAADGTPSGCAMYEFDSSDRVSFLTSYGGVSCAVAGLSVAKSASSATARSATRAIAPLKVPGEIAYAVPSIPDAAALSALGVSGYAYWNYDAFGSSELSMDKDWYPVRVARVDSRVAKTVSMELAWSAGHRIIRKKSYYGSTLALDVSMEYTDDGYPLKASTSGAAMLLPLDYELVYAGGVPARLNVSSNGSLLQWFKYEYTGAALPTSFPAIRGIDPFALLDGLAKSSLVIEHYDGDDLLIETFTFISNPATAVLKLEVENATGDSNGYYEAAYEGELIASLKAFNASGMEQWEYSYGYAEAMDDAAALAGAVGIPADFGRLAETYLTDDIQEYAKGFVMDLLF